MRFNRNIKRLLLYKSSLHHFRELGLEKVYSHNIANELGYSPEQVRKDFSLFGIKGNKKGGYIIEVLIEQLNMIFHKDQKQNVIVVGMGNIGQALINYKGFVTGNINIIGSFDIDSFKQSTRNRIPVYPMENLSSVILKYQVKIAILAVPKISAQNVTDKLVDNGIMAIMNFAPIHLKVPDDVFVRYINLSNALDILVYYTANIKSDNDA